MGVATWLVIVACFCVLQGSLGSGPERKRYPAIAKMLRRLTKKQVSPVPTVWTPATPTLSPTISPTLNPTAPQPIDFYQHWVDCPVFESILQEYFWDFPNTQFPKDSINISPVEMEQVLTRGVSAFDYLKNVRVAVDLLMEDTARLVLDKRVNCTTTMYQRAFVYYMRKRLDQMMSPRDTSLKSRIEVILNKYFPNNPSILSHAQEIVWGIHYVVHESFIYFLQEEEFQSLGWFLRDYKWNIPHFLERFHRGEFASINEVVSQMTNDFFSYGSNYPGALSCTTPQEFINMHMRVSNATRNNYWQAHKSGIAVTFLTNHLQELFYNTHNPIPVNLDPLIVDDAIRKLVKVILDYMNDTMAELKTYEGYLASATLTPPTFMASSLSDVQWNMTMRLFIRMFPNSPTQFPGTVSPGPGISPGDIAMYLQQDVNILKKIQSLMPVACTSNQQYTMIENELINMINEKENIINGSPPGSGYVK